jgi:hypothetical protein
MAGRPEPLDEWIGVTSNHLFQAVSSAGYDGPYDTYLHRNDGWTEARNIRNGAVYIELIDGNYASTGHGELVFRTKTSYLGWSAFDRKDWSFGGWYVDFRTAPFNTRRRRWGTGKMPEERSLMTRTVYNIEVQDNRTYYVGGLGLWVHQKMLEPSPAPVRGL